MLVSYFSSLAPPRFARASRRGPLLLLLLLAGCAASDGNWPLLSDPLPKAEERTIETPALVTPSATPHSEPFTADPDRSARLWRAYGRDYAAFAASMTDFRGKPTDRSLWITAHRLATNASQTLDAYAASLRPPAIEALRDDKDGAALRERIEGERAKISRLRQELGNRPPPL